MAAVFNTVKGLIENDIRVLVNYFTVTLPNAWNRAKDIATGVFNAIKDTLVSRFNAMVDFAGSIPGRIIGFFSNLGDRFRSVGGDIVQGIINGLNGAVGRLAGAAADMANRALDSAKHALGISSPSKVFEREVGMMAGEGMTRGLEKSMPSVSVSASKLASAAGTSAANTASAGAAGGGDMAALLAMVERLIAEVRRVAPGVGQELTGVQRAAMQVARAR
jgi:hypothetical protein